MKKLFILLLISLFYYRAWSQQAEIKWSPFDDKDKKEALVVANEFMESYIKKDFQEAQKYMAKNEINYGGEIWLKPTEFIAMITDLRGNNEIKVDKILAYTMDDTEINPEIKDKALKLFRMFSNLSIFININLLDITENTTKNLCLNLNLDEDKNWIINCIIDISITMIENINYPKERFRVEVFKEEKFEIPIPTYFLKGQVLGSQTNYTLPGQTERDASLQVDYYEMKAPVSIMSYSWVQYLVSKYEHSDILIKYMPYGYKYEYFVKDQNGKLNKGITIAFESNKNLYSFSIFLLLRPIIKYGRM